MAAGAIYAGRSATLSDQLSGRAIVVVTVLLAASLLVVAYLLRGEEGPMRELEDSLSLAPSVILVLVTSAVIAGTRAAARILPIERRIFETYLLHVPLMGILWVAWTTSVRWSGRDQ